jgi:UDP-3-O-[3-hydroxymyristoyl] glucosamine N-acyltransferase
MDVTDTADSAFFLVSSLSLADIVALTGAAVSGQSSEGLIITGVGALSEAGAGDISFLDNPKYRRDLTQTAAAACFISQADRDLVPQGTLALVVPHPYAAFAKVAQRLFPAASYPAPLFGEAGVNPGSTVHAHARLEGDISLDPGVVIGPFAEVGEGTTIGANSVIGPGVRIGRKCHIGPNVTITHALIGNDVIIQAGTSIGQDGFGFAIGREGHEKVPQIGRAIIQDRVELGANVTIDRGGVRDTIVGEGSKLDNMVHVAHNVVIGRHCLIAAQVGISGSTEIGDFVIIGGQVGITGHVKIGAGSQIAGGSGIISDLPPRSKVGGYPARPLKTWFREVATLARLAVKTRGGHTSDETDQGSKDSGHD